MVKVAEQGGAPYAEGLTKLARLIGRRVSMDVPSPQDPRIARRGCGMWPLGASSSPTKGIRARCRVSCSARIAVFWPRDQMTRQCSSGT